MGRFEGFKNRIGSSTRLLNINVFTICIIKPLKVL